MTILIALIAGLVIGFALDGALVYRDIRYMFSKGYKPALQAGRLIWVRDVS